MTRSDDLQPPVLPEPTLRSRLRELSSPRRAGIAALVVFTTGLATLLLLARSDMESVAPLRLVGGVVGFGLAGVAIALVVLRPLHRRPLPGVVSGALVACALLAPAAFAFLPEAHHERLLHPESFADEESRFWGRAGACLLLGSLMALPFLAVVAAMDRRNRLGRARAFQIAVAGGAIGNLALLLHCPLVSHGHLLAGHATVPVFLALLVGSAVWLRARRAS